MCPLVPCCLAPAVVSPGGEGLKGEDAGDVDVNHFGTLEAGLEHGVQADHVEQIQLVVARHFRYIRQILGAKLAFEHW